MTVRSITDIDSNFRAASVPFENAVRRDALGGSFDIRGLYKPLETGTYQRLPLEFANDVRLNGGARSLMFHTAGGRVEFIDGENLYVCDNWDDCTVDGVHPNDLGFRMFAERIQPMLAKCLGMV